MPESLGTIILSVTNSPSLNLVGGIGVAELETFRVLPVKAIVLKSLHGNRGLGFVFKVHKTKEVLTASLGGLGNESRLNVSGEGSEDVRDFTLRGIKGDSVYIQTVGGILGNHKELKLLGTRIEGTIIIVGIHREVH